MPGPKDMVRNKPVIWFSWISTVSTERLQSIDQSNTADRWTEKYSCPHTGLLHCISDSFISRYNCMKPHHHGYKPHHKNQGNQICRLCPKRRRKQTQSSIMPPISSHSFRHLHKVTGIQIPYVLHEGKCHKQRNPSNIITQLSNL